MRKWLLVIPLALATIFCTVGVHPAAPTQDVSAIVNATLTAIAAKAPPTSVPATSTSAPSAPVDTPTLVSARDFIPPLGTISGRLSYPASALPPMRIVAFNVSTGEVSYTNTAPGQDTYSFDLPAGAYHIVAYSLPGGGFPGGLAGGYTQAVPCGLSVSCTDHSLIAVTVTESVTAPNIDPGDWYAPNGSFPAMPSP